MIYDDVASHLGEAGRFDHAAVPLGVYLAWCANHRLLSEPLEQRAAALIVRVRYREISGGELVVSGCAGELADEHLNPEGQAFTAGHYHRYLAAFHASVAGNPYAVDDEWAVYDRLAGELTRWLMAFREGRAAGDGAGSHPERRPWWKLWK